MLARIQDWQDGHGRAGGRAQATQRLDEAHELLNEVANLLTEMRRTDLDGAWRGRADVQFCQSPMIASGVCLGLALRLLSAGVRRLGVWACQPQFGRLSILFVLLNRDDRRRAQQRAQLASRPDLLQ